MEWAQFFGLIFIVIGFFFWNRTEANSDRKEMLNLMNAIELEMKDFHNRLCALEERIKNDR